MKLVAILLTIATMLCFASTTSAARQNLLPNNSFEKGFDYWEHYVQSAIVNDGYCGRHSVALYNGYVRNIGFFMREGKTYKLSFRYKGEILSSMLPAENLKSKTWARYTKIFKADYRETIWFMGTGQVDCVRLVRFK